MAVVMLGAMFVAKCYLITAIAGMTLIFFFTVLWSCGPLVMSSSSHVVLWSSGPLQPPKSLEISKASR